MNKLTFGLQRSGGEDRVGGVGRSLRSLRMVAVAVLLAGTVAVGLFASQASAAPSTSSASSAHADAAQANGSWGWLYYKHGYYLDNGWLCYGWSNGAYHCTQHWHWSNGKLISDHPSWVPNYGSSSASHSSGSSGSATHSNNGGGTPSYVPPSTGSVQGEIQAVFGPYAWAALAVARCESGYNPSAYNASSGASGVFQFLYSTWMTTSYAGYSRFNAWANINAAHQVFVRDGYSWREWQCQP